MNPLYLMYAPQVIMAEYGMEFGHGMNNVFSCFPANRPTEPAIDRQIETQESIEWK